MMWRDGEVLSLRSAWGPAGRSCAELEVRVSAAPAGARCLGPGQVLRAIAYEQVTGVPEPGERVRLEVSALDRGLGTGGHAMVTARLSVLAADAPCEGHLVKARYMPDQVMVAGADEQGAAHHEVLSRPVGTLHLDGAPVVVADLHSSLPAVLAGLRSAAGGRGEDAPGPRTVYVMTDGGALPLAYSRTVALLREAGWLVGTVTAGQAWGGDLEAVSLHNALLAARHVLRAEVVVVAQGPGNLGTDTPWGFSGVACGDAVNAVAVLGGRPVACLRVSEADARERHRGVSHHSLTAYGRVALAAADVAVPLLEGPLGEQVLAQARRLCAPRAVGAQHRRVDVALDGLMEALTRMEAATGVRLSTMGRSLDADRTAFLTAAAAGRHAASLLAGTGRGHGAGVH
ncbi:MULTISPECIES: DUF3866 family protein [unclassified Actinomyces]|uniref:DUF3866 family protein n=1 Tax=unclassified Actinomyces TaxID=2609248 RepID=UPI0020171F18|nr:MULTISPECIES: DUF3866 family protein [unclassified Actinomyces]MCL3778183.1 DUF3866 family protein [Actinomyces sp. AC-20-1]MCL3790838.1 DUF3866 family protein [Actinomyces sp. 187325]MCL3793100.1 DUF3866 family protein [Actinomyces sp. 186855]MCL3795521.1 DUF3866 family protein [Actinomyces sp. 217892]